ncbi:MAG: RHS repeat-associated core domain-containing protein, partial [Ruminococcus sp.]|nr:RHS repeat-associated core domain-containing protein [Ruminococcus sp.]
GFYYLMSRYYDPVTHRFINADGYFQAGNGILDANTFAYCSNNPIMNIDPTGLCYVVQRTSAGTYIGTIWNIKTAVPGVPGFCNNCKSYGPNSGNNYYAAASKNNKNTKGDSNWTPRKDSKKGVENRQQSGDRERNVAHPNGEEHSRVPKGNGIKRLTETTFDERMSNFGICMACAVAVIYLVGNDFTGVGVADDVALIPTIILLWDSANKAFG